jgi:glycosyltransferase involved in cell wall biosynthesis
MRIFYVNRRLTQYHSAPGEWGRQVLFGLRRAGATVSSYPAVDEPAAASAGGPAHAAAQPRDVTRYRSLLWSHYSRGWMAWLLEAWMMVRGGANTIAGFVWALWHRRRIETDVVLGRQAEYEATSQLVALVLGRPLVLEVHSIHFIERQMRGRRPSRLLRALEFWQWRRSARIWVNSEALKSIIVEHGIAADAVRVISFGVDLERFAPRRRAAGCGSEIRVAFVGSFSSWHGTEVLLRAFAAAFRQAPGLRLAMIGDGAQRRPSEALARELGIAEAVEFTGWVSNEAVIERLGRADIGVAPYLAIEPFYFDPAKIIEYMAAGLAVLASDQGRVRDMVEDDISGLLLPPGDEAALTAALLRLANDKALRERLGQAARKRAETQYNWPEICRQALALCAEAARGG